MENCLVTVLKGVMENNNSPFLDSIVVHIDGLSSTTLTFGKSSGDIRSNSDTSVATILNGSKTFDGGGTSAFLKDSPVISVSDGDSFDIKISEADNITRINRGNFNSLYTTLSRMVTLLPLKNIEMLHVYSIGDLIPMLANSITSFGTHNGDINLNTLFNENDLSNIETFTLAGVTAKGSVSIKDIANAFQRNGENKCTIWNQVINFNYNGHTKETITGDIMDVPDNVYYINVPSKVVLSCGTGKRNTSSCKILCTGTSGIRLNTSTEVDNYLINSSGCSMESGVSISYKNIILKTEDGSTYTPSSEAQTAITLLYSKGVASIKVNGTEMR